MSSAQNYLPVILTILCTDTKRGFILFIAVSTDTEIELFIDSFISLFSNFFPAHVI